MDEQKSIKLILIISSISLVTGVILLGLQIYQMAARPNFPPQSQQFPGQKSGETAPTGGQTGQPQMGQPSSGQVPSGGKCGDGTCDSIEKQLNVCPEDCKK